MSGGQGRMMPVERRRRVVRAVVAIERFPVVRGGVAAFHVLYFGVPECAEVERALREQKLPPSKTVANDLRWACRKGYLRRSAISVGRFQATDAGRAWARV